MILLDTSIVIQLCRRPSTLSHNLPPLDEICICGVTKAELLQGIRSENEARYIDEMLLGFHQIPIVEEIWTETGLNLRRLRRGGITVPFPDAILLSTAIHDDLEVWSSDSHFALARGILPELRLYSPLE
jgi:predicted nucleic acid-binding protein